MKGPVTNTWGVLLSAICLSVSICMPASANDLGSKSRTIACHGGAECVAFSPDGAILAAGGNEKEIRVFDVTTGKLLRTLQGHTDTIRSLSFSPDGKTIVSGSDDKSIKLWDAATGKLLTSLDGQGDQVMAVAFSPDGRTFASGCEDGLAKIFDAASNRELLTLKGHDGGVDSLSFAKDGKKLATGGFDGTVKIWDTSSGKDEQTIKTDLKQVESLDYSPDGKNVTAASEMAVQTYDAATGKPLRCIRDAELMPAGIIHGLAYSPDGRTLATGQANKLIMLYDTTTAQPVRILTGHREPVRAVAFSANGNLLASAGEDDILRLWDVAWTQGPHKPIALPRANSPSSRFQQLSDYRDGVRTGRITYIGTDHRRDPQIERVVRSTRYWSNDRGSADISYLYNKVDLNGDGKPEVLVLLYGVDCCGSGGCPAFVLTPAGKRLSIVCDQTLCSTPIIVCEEKTKGWKNLIFCSRYGYFPSRWAGTRYVSAKDPLGPGEVISGTALLADQKDRYNGLKVPRTVH